MRVATARLIRLVLFAFLTGLPGAGRAEAPAGFEERGAELVARYAQEGVFSGAVIVVEHGRPILRRAAGLAEREWGAQNTPETRFRIASLSKQFTAAAVLKLVEAGRLDLDGPAIRYVPDLPATWAPITLRMLLTHTSGLPNITALPDYSGTLARLEADPRALVGRLEREELLFPAGAAQEYSNTGYILLAAIVERVTGQRFAEHLEAAILKPLGLRATMDADPTRIIAQRAAGYRRVAGRWRHATPLAAGAAVGAGDLVSTVDDLAAWDEALLAGRVISAASLAAMTHDDGRGYGFGLYLGKAHGHRLWSHGGFISGFTAIKDTYPDLGLTIVVLGNTEIAPAQTMSRSLAALYVGAVDPAQAVRIDAAVLGRYVGSYRLGTRHTASVALEDGGLVLRLPGHPRLTLTPESDRTFTAPGGVRITFDIEPDGRATGALVYEDGRHHAGPRMDPSAIRRRVDHLVSRALHPFGTASPDAERQRR